MKPLVVVAAENLASCRIVRPLLARLAGEIELVMLVPNVPTDSDRARRRALRLVRRASLPFLVFKLVEIHVHHLLALSRRATVRHEAARAGVRVRRYSSVRDPRFLADLAAASPRFLLSAGPAILTGDVLAVPSEGTLNCHGARLPEYRGAANYVWMLVAGECEAYATIQLMQLGLDEGPPLAERRVEIGPRWSAYRVDWEVAGAGGELYAETVASALADGLPPALDRPGAIAANRGLPGREDVAALRRAGRRLLRLRDVLTCV